MRARFIAPLLLLAAFAASPAAAQLPGRYQLVSINGQPLPVASSAYRGVTVTRALFWFEEDGRYNMAMSGDTESEGPARQHAAGAYVVVADSVRLMREFGEGTFARYRWVRQGDTLHLYDAEENAYRLLRDNAAAASEPWSPGTWTAIQLNGRDMPAPWFTDPESTMTEVTFIFTAGGRATLRLRGGTPGDPDEDVDTFRYRVAGDRILFLDERDGEVDDAVVWSLRNGILQLTDDRGNVYTLTRRPGRQGP
jgi:hypothetical protein